MITMPPTIADFFEAGSGVNILPCGRRISFTCSPMMPGCNVIDERKDPDGDYCADNCEFACVICNNAKSDMISAEDFKKFFVPGIKEYWKHIEEEIKKKNP